MTAMDAPTKPDLVLADTEADEPFDLTDEFLVSSGDPTVSSERKTNGYFGRALPPAYVPLRIAVVANLAEEADPYIRARIFMDFLDGLETAIRQRPRSSEAKDVGAVIAAIRDHLQGVAGSDSMLHHGVQAISCALLTALTLRGLDEAVAARAIVSQIENLGFPAPDGDPDLPSWARLLAWRELMKEGRLNVYLRTIYKGALALALKTPSPKERVSGPPAEPD